MSLLDKSDSLKPTFEPADDSHQFKGQLKDFIWETLKVIIISLVIIVPVRYFLIQPFYVKGASMEPNFYDHEYLIIDEISYRLNSPERGDIVVFRYPYDPSQYFIKRIIGLPGETLRLNDGEITIANPSHPDGFILDEDLYLPDIFTQGSADITLDFNQYYILGDNRASSLDSRSFGPIELGDIIGKVWVRGWPFNRINLFNDPVY